MCFSRPQQPQPIVNTPAYSPEDAYKHMDIWKEQDGKVIETLQGTANGTPETPSAPPKPAHMGEIEDDKKRPTGPRIGMSNRRIRM